MHEHAVCCFGCFVRACGVQIKKDFEIRKCRKRIGRRYYDRVWLNFVMERLFVEVRRFVAEERIS